MTLWYMRDNHTTASLPLEVDAAIARLRDVFMAPIGRYGALLARGGPMNSKSISALNDWNAFEPQARAFVIAALAPTPTDIEYESWVAQLTGADRD